MGYHIFLAERENFDVCIRRGVYGGVMYTAGKKAEQLNAEVIASFQGIKIGDFIFFYVKKEGLYGLWKVTSEPFYDTTPIWDNPEQIYPYRVTFEPVVRKFPKPIVLSDILDLRDKGKIWTFDLGIFVKKSHYPITTEEGKELLRLLLRNNPIYHPVEKIPNLYIPQNPKPLPMELDCDSRGRIHYEGYLNAWFMKAFASNRLREIIGEYGDFINYAPTSFNTVMDLFLTHVTTIDSIDILHKFTCIELKTGTVNEKDLNQILMYEDWLIRKLASGDTEMVQSILVGHEFTDEVIQYVEKRKNIEAKTVRLIEYKVNDSYTDIILREVENWR